ncbi:MAG: cytochrome c [Candidatus Margulisbacteria bacterium]|nr:cytochrome c [Candidatus Margulisiibacteriota bacterium]
MTLNSCSRTFFGVVCCTLIFMSGCRGYRSEKPPIHMNPNMDTQPKYIAQQLSLTPPSGTIPWGKGNTTQGPRQDFVKSDSFYHGKVKGSWITTIPADVTIDFVKRGQERFNIYCAVCHDRAGSGKGMVVQRGFIPPPPLYDQRIVAYTNGELFDIISHGIRNMPGYKHQLSESDRWAVVSYIRALQKSQRATLKDVPSHMRNKVAQ